jgi:glycosyltransferase involved in cell wall biosynthesis
VTPRVSIVIPLHEAAGTIGQTLDSIEAQELDDWELLVVDDASTDEGPQLVGERLDARGRLLAAGSPTARGPAATRNRGLAVARAPFVVFLDADDLWAPTFLTRRLAVLEADPTLGLAWGPARYWYPDDPALSHDQPTGLSAAGRLAPGAPLAGWLAQLRSTPCTMATVFRRDALVDVGGYPEQLRRGEDIATCVLVAADRASWFDPDVLATYRRHARSATHASADRAAEDVAFGQWLVGAVRERPDLAPLRRLAARDLHGLVHQQVAGRGYLAGRRAIASTLLRTPGARHRWWAVALDGVLPLPLSRRVAFRLERAVGDDGH